MYTIKKNIPAAVLLLIVAMGVQISQCYAANTKKIGLEPPQKQAELGFHFLMDGNYSDMFFTLFESAGERISHEKKLKGADEIGLFLAFHERYLRYELIDSRRPSESCEILRYLFVSERGPVMLTLYYYKIGGEWMIRQFCYTDKYDDMGYSLKF